jgi:hypothetical protein
MMLFWLPSPKADNPQEELRALQQTATLTALDERRFIEDL